MMDFDCIIIGGGISGLTCGIKCLCNGLTCAIISSGMSALHFSSGSLDLLGYYPGRNVVYSPFSVLDDFVRDNPIHPYAKCGNDIIHDAFTFIKNETKASGLELYANNGDNHFHVTPIGTIKPTYISQKSVYSDNMKTAFETNSSIAIVSFEEFRDFHPGMVVENLKKHPLFEKTSFTSAYIGLPRLSSFSKNPYEFRSIDIARIFDTDEYIHAIAHQIVHAAKDAKIVCMPAFIGITHYNSVLEKLSELTGRFIYEIPTLPPSILGMRLDNALKTRFNDLGGVFISGDRVVGGNITGNTLNHIFTENKKSRELTAHFFVLSTGSFFSNGLKSDSDVIQEPIFGLMTNHSPERKTWRSHSFFDPGSHPFLHFGVKTNHRFNPYDRHGNTIQNMFCAGAILSDYNPIKEGSGSGVAISTGFFAAEQIAGHTRETTID